MNKLNMLLEVTGRTALLSALSTLELPLPPAAGPVVSLHCSLLDKLLLTTRAWILLTLVLFPDVLVQTVNSFAHLSTVRADKKFFIGMGLLVPLQM